MGTDSCQQLIETIRQQCLAKGLSGIKGLCVLFRGMDTDYSQFLTFDEFNKGMRGYNISLSEDELKAVFMFVDRDKSGTVDFREFLDHLRPPMPQCRIDVVNEAFDKMDVIKDGLLKVDDLKGRTPHSHGSPPAHKLLTYGYVTHYQCLRMK